MLHKENQHELNPHKIITMAIAIHDFMSLTINNVYLKPRRSDGWIHVFNFTFALDSQTGTTVSVVDMCEVLTHVKLLLI